MPWDFAQSSRESYPRLKKCFKISDGSKERKQCFFLALLRLTSEAGEDKCLNLLLPVS